MKALHTAEVGKEKRKNGSDTQIADAADCGHAKRVCVRDMSVSGNCLALIMSAGAAGLPSGGEENHGGHKGRSDLSSYNTSFTLPSSLRLRDLALMLVSVSEVNSIGRF